jgi:hypothetical protein
MPLDPDTLPGPPRQTENAPTDCLGYDACRPFERLRRCCGTAERHPRSEAGRLDAPPGQARTLASVEVRAFQHVVNGLGVHAKRAADPDCGQFAVVHQPVHRHLADPHQARHFGDGEKLSSWRLTVGGSGVSRRLSTSRIPRRWPVHRRHRNPIHQARAVPAASPPLAPTRAYHWENSVANGVTATGVGYSIRIPRITPM